MALYFREKKDGQQLPDGFKEKRFRSYADMAAFAEEHHLPHGEYWIRNDKGANLATSIRELKYSKTRFWVEGRGNVSASEKPLSISQYEKLDEIKRILSEKAAEPEMPYWFYAEAQTVYGEGFSFCRDCIKAIVPDAKIGEHYGGGYCCESDSREFCEQCDKLLQYVLTDYGVDTALVNWEEVPPENLNDADECYELTAIAHGLYTDEQKRQFLRLMAKAMKPQKPAVEVYEGEDAYQMAKRKARYGHRNWFAWRDKDGRSFAAPATAESCKLAMLTTGTQGRFTLLSASDGTAHSSSSWELANIWLARLKAGRFY